MLVLRTKTEAGWALAHAPSLSKFLFFRYLNGVLILLHEVKTHQGIGKARFSDSLREKVRGELLHHSD